MSQEIDNIADMKGEPLKMAGNSLGCHLIGGNHRMTKNMVTESVQRGSIAAAARKGRHAGFFASDFQARQAMQSGLRDLK